KAGDRLSLDFYVWRDAGDLETKSHEFVVKAVVPLAGAAADRNLVPEYPGITGAESLSDWDPPFPIDLKRIHPSDEDYWKRYKTTPKAFVPYDVARKLWGTRYGDRTSVRIVAPQSRPDAMPQFVSALRASLDPASAGFVVRDARAEGLSASAGSTDFGEYFVYFSFFLVVSALVLAALFFRLGVEQRAREVGLLRAVGFSTPRVRRLFTAEGYLLAVPGRIVGLSRGPAGGARVVPGPRTRGSGAVG